MSHYARRHLVCASYRDCPDGWRAWSGMMNGYTTRPWCGDVAGHPDDHTAIIEKIGDEHKKKTMTWMNTIGMPEWLVKTTIHGLRIHREHLERDNPAHANVMVASINELILSLEDEL